MQEWMLENLNWFDFLLITTLFSALNIIVAICNFRITKHQNKMQNDSFCFQHFAFRASFGTCYYILENKTTVRKVAKKYNISKSTVQSDKIEKCPSFPVL